MKNREKYPNTDDAVKAYEEHKKECNCDCTFEDWLDHDEDKTKEFVDKLDGLFAASLFGPIGFGLLAGLKRRRAEASAPKSDSEKPAEPSAGKSNSGGIECPICHGKNGRICSGSLYVDFHCPDCDALIIRKRDIERAPFGSSSPDEFEAWFANLGTSAKKD